MAQAENVTEFLDRFLPLFYLRTPSGSSFNALSEVPDYLQQSTPNFFILIVIEAVVRWLQRKTFPRANNSMSSVSNGIFLELSRMALGTVELALYIWIYNNLRIVSLPWNSAITWWIAFFAMDFGYYWFHRMSHEVNFMWMAHQVHHSSEDFVLTTALRQSMLQNFTTWPFFVPFALFLPPSVYFVHKQLNLLYQFWIHTEIVSNLGPLEWILNTPSHHRVHHGRNPYCIDKNYAGVLIIWDRMFGTFAPESDKVVYGLVHPLTSWNPLWAQFDHAYYIISSIGSQKGFRGMLSFLLNGPGWSPGKPRLGDIKDLPEVSPDEKPYDPDIPLWLSSYCVAHFLLLVYWYNELGVVKNDLPYLTLMAVSVYLVFSMITFGMLYDRRSEIAVLEPLRLSIYLMADILLILWNLNSGMPAVVMMLVRIFFGLSLILWVPIAVKFVQR